MLRSFFLTLCLVLASTVAFAEEVTLVVAHDATWPPMEFIDANKQIVGYSVDYIDAVAKEAGFKVVHKSVAWDGIFAGLPNKKYDVIASSVTITEERAKQMDFSIPYYEVKQAVVVPKDSTATDMSAFKGKTLGAQIGTTGYMAIKRAEDVTAKSYDEIGLAMEDLFNGRLDGVVCDDPTAANYILENKNYAETMKLAFIIPADVPEYYGFAVDKGNTQALDLLNKGIKAVKEKGIQDQIRKKWMPGS